MCDKWVNCCDDCTNCDGKSLAKDDCFGILLTRRGKENGRLIVVISSKVLELIPYANKIEDTEGYNLYAGWGYDVDTFNVGYSNSIDRRSKGLDILYESASGTSIETRAAQYIKKTRKILTNALNSIVDYPEQVVY